MGIFRALIIVISIFFSVLANTRDTRSGRLSAGRLDLSKLEVRASKRSKDKRGSLDSIVHIDDGEVSFKKRKSASQPYEIVDGGKL